MGRKFGLWAVSLLLWSITVNAQQETGTGDMSDNEFRVKLKGTVVPLRLEISERKTTNLIFPYAIISVDRGSPSVLAQKPKGVENILQLKSATAFSGETNLTVVTADGAFYSFELAHAIDPSHLNIKVQSRPSDIKSPLAMFSSDRGYEDRLARDAQWVSFRRVGKGPDDRSGDMAISLTGVYVSQGVLYFRLELENSGNIPYDAEQLRLFIRDGRATKRTAVQEIELRPIIAFGDSQQVNAKSRHVVVLGLRKFTIPDGKRLHIQVSEKDGGRNLELRIKNKHVIKAKEIR